jgi:peptidyl-prolyl cis-trans isomerase D
MLLILCGSMVTFLIPGFMSDSTASASGSVASVAGHNIQMAEVQTTAARIVQQQMRQGYPEFYRQMLIQQSYPAAVDQLMQNEEIRYECDRMGLRVSDQELRDALRTGPDGPYFFPGGKWVGQERYEELLREAQLTVDVYERNLRMGLLRQKLFATIAAGVDVAPAELQKAYKEQNTKIKFDYAVITKEDLEKQVKTNDTELKAYFAAHKASYANAIPEKRQVRYFVIDHKQAEAKTTVTPSDLQQYYGTHQDQYKTQERVKARHILINTPVPGPDGKVDEKAVEAAKIKAADILKQLKNGSDFAEMAKKNSQDSSGKEGGDLGWIVRGQMVAPFEKAAFSMSKGQMSDLVQSDFGFHIIQVEDKEDAHVKSFSEVRDEVEKAVKAQKAGDWLGQTVESVQAQARAESLDKAAAKVGSQVVLSNPIAMNDSLPGVGPAPEFTQAVFSTTPKSGAQAARFGDGVAIFEVTRIDPAKAPDFDTVKDRVVKDFKSEQATHKLQTTLQEMADRAHTEHDLRKAAREAGATVKTSNLVAGKDNVQDIGPMNGQAREAFNLKSGEISGPINLGNKGVVIALTERQEPSAEEAAKGSDEIREQLIDRKRQQEFAIYLSILRTRLEKDGKEKIYKGVMESLTKGRG